MFRYISIKLKITLWYAFFMVGLVAGILVFLGEFTDNLVLSNQKNQLIENVEETVEDIYKGKKYDYFDDGIFILVYDENKNFKNGSIPFEFDLLTKFEFDKIQKIKLSEYNFYVYDKKIVDKYGNIYFVRGVFLDTQINQLTSIVIKLAFVILPLLTIISLVIGYILTKKALLPVKRIQETAQKITDDNQLSLRINLSKGKDEISKLAFTIDNMLEKLEEGFLREKKFTSDASHELRTPISVILAESDYILRHCESIEEAKESMEVINRQADKISKLINQLLFLARNGEKNIKPNLEKINIIQITEEIIGDNMLKAKEKNIQISLYHRNEEKYFFVDKIMFGRAVQNMLQNAITYGKENGKIIITLFEKDDFFAIKIEDDGIGISEEKIRYIWNRFYQIDESRNGSNMGLGLSIVKLIVEKHNGYVEVKSEVGIGSEFVLYFKKF